MDTCGPTDTLANTAKFRHTHIPHVQEASDCTTNMPLHVAILICDRIYRINERVGLVPVYIILSQ